MKPPRVRSLDVDWDAVRAALADFAPLVSQDNAGGATTDPVARLNEATKRVFPKIGVSPVPVLLPFDTAALLRDEAAGAAGATGAAGAPIDSAKYLSGFHASSFFVFPGPAGYDAALSLQARDNPGLDLTFGRRVDMQISASAVIYELDGPAVPEGTPVPELDAEFPGIRRLLLENYLRFTFVRFGVPYFVTIGCFDGPRRVSRLSCREADKVGVAFLKALNIVGGAPHPPPFPPTQAGQGGEEVALQTIDRPDKNSADFTYYAPGDILPGTGMRGRGGRADATVYAKIRFPIAQAPSYVNSQVFMNWGGCDFTGRVALGGRGKDATYRCRVNAMPLVHDESKNYAYPWRDNFCEHRYFAVSQCPTGLGHQGEDIRPGSCVLRNPEADRCEPYQHDIVAARDGVVLREPGDEALYLLVNAPGEHIRFRYLHMDPRLLDAAGMVSGRELSEGEVIGAVDNYETRQGGTTYHLHFDAEVLTREGWMFVNPYMTLVAAYERLIGGRGKVVNDAMFATASAGEAAAPADGQVLDSPDHGGAQGAAVSADMSAAKASRARSEDSAEKSRNTARERRAIGAEHCRTRMVKGHRRRRCGIDVAKTRERATHAHAVRSVGRRVSHEGHGARHHGAGAHARHAHRASRHGRA